MSVEGFVYSLREPKKALVKEARTWATPEAGFALLEVLGCGVCHTDLGYADGDVAPVQALPIVLGHEIVGRVIAESGAPHLMGMRVLAPAVSPCGECAFCRRGRATACPKGRMPGNHADGGFATHCVVPCRDLVALDREAGAEGKLGKAGLDAWQIAPVADAATTAYQAIVRAGLSSGDVAVFVGAGGVGGFGMQLAKAEGARVIGLDVDTRRLDEYTKTVDLTINVKGIEAKAVRAQVRDFIKQQGLRDAPVRVFETSGTSPGQLLAFSLLERGGSLSVVGFTPEKVPLRLSNVMALDVDVYGNWGCGPELYGAVIERVLDGRVEIDRFVERFSLDQVNEVLDRVRRHELARRAVLIP